jgi:hypothetical protein
VNAEEDAATDEVDGKFGPRRGTGRWGEKEEWRGVGIEGGVRGRGGVE